MKCKICNNSKENKTFIIRDIFFELRDRIKYIECSLCKCLQLYEIPSDLRGYYPKYYYAHKRDSKIKQILKSKRDKYELRKVGFIGKMISMRHPNPLLKIMRRMRIRTGSKILDVGSGLSNYLFSLKKIGFKNVIGIDPFIESEHVKKGLKILKKSIFDFSDDNDFDLIIFNHSFEHIPNQRDVLVKTRKILHEEGICLIRMPVKTDYIWNRYGIHWVQIDAPRHVIIHTRKSFRLLVEKANLMVKDEIFDSTDFQFWGSEQNLRGISLLSENSYSINPRKSIFSKKQINKYKCMANRLNHIEQGDQASFIVGKI